MKKLKLATKITLIVSLSISMILIGSFSYLIIRQYHQDIEKADSDANKIAVNTSIDIKSNLESALYIARGLAQSIGAYESFPLSERRMIGNSMIKQIAAENENILGAWVCFEPNMLDGMDSQFANTANYDSTGRFIPYWTRNGDSIEYSILADYTTPGAGDYYLAAKNSGKETILDPYLYNISGKDVLLTTFSVPIYNQEGYVVGVAGVDVSLDMLNQKNYDSTEYKSENLFLLSSDGTLIIHTNKDNLGKNIYDVETDKQKVDALLKSIQAGNAYVYDTESDINGKACTKTLVPITFGNSSTFWAVGVSIELDEIMKQTNKNLIVMILILLSIIIVTVLTIGISFKYMINKPLSSIVSVAQQQANGNLDIDLNTNRKDELGILYQALQTANKNMNDSLLIIKTAATEVSSGATQISSASIQLSQGATEQASSIQEISASINDISAKTIQSTDNAKTANMKAENSRNLADRGMQQMTQLLSAMKNIRESSENIIKIIKVIEDIAFQTNILALNAAVEAARAGENGKGFAVVAQEVKNLATKSAKAASETTLLIEESVRKAETGGLIANETEKALSAIVKEIDDVAVLIKDIAGAIDDQSINLNHVNQSIGDISQVVQANSAASEENAAASEELNGQSDSLLEQVSRFKLKTE